MLEANRFHAVCKRSRLIGRQPPAGSPNAELDALLNNLPALRFSGVTRNVPQNRFRYYLV
jgi:hypothetical protein